VPAGSRTLIFKDITGWAKPRTNSFTLAAGTVFATNGVYLALSNDTDGDGLPDDWEIQHFSNLTLAGFGSDFDGDGLTDYYEWLAGTDPKDSRSCIAFLRQGGISRAPIQGVTLSWYSGSNMVYRVLRSTNLLSGFQVFDAQVPATPPVNFYTDPTAVGPAPFFYRIGLTQ
jgi:hypothetical protein